MHSKVRTHTLKDMPQIGSGTVYFGLFPPLYYACALERLISQVYRLCVQGMFV